MENLRFRFRAWNKEKDIIHYEAEKGLGDFFPFPYMCKSNDFIVEQCTGLKDKHGRLIYEGDFLINHDGNIGFIEFKYACFMLTAINEDNIMSTEDWTTCEVIGNIHENADLLEGGK